MRPVSVRDTIVGMVTCVASMIVLPLDNEKLFIPSNREPMASSHAKAAKFWMSLTASLVTASTPKDA